MMTGEIKILLEVEATSVLKRETSQLKREKLHTHSTGSSFLHEGEVMTAKINQHLLFQYHDLDKINHKQ